MLSDIEVDSYLINWNLEHVTVPKSGKVRVWVLSGGEEKLGLNGSQLIVDSNAN